MGGVHNLGTMCVGYNIARHLQCDKAGDHTAFIMRLLYAMYVRVWCASSYTLLTRSVCTTIPPLCGAHSFSRTYLDCR